LSHEIDFVAGKRFCPAGIGTREQLGWQDNEIRRKESGEPYVMPYVGSHGGFGGVKKLCGQLFIISGE
jgi:hypothetical protein